MLGPFASIIIFKIFETFDFYQICFFYARIYPCKIYRTKCFYLQQPFYDHVTCIAHR